MSDILPWVFFGVWVFAIVCCTELGWRIPIVREVLFQAEQRREETQKKMEEYMNRMNDGP